MGLLDQLMKIFKAFGEASSTISNSKNYLVNFTVKGSGDWDGEHYMRVPIVGEYTDAQAIRALRMMNGLDNNVEIIITQVEKED
ncbi:MAG: hypothetical protein J6T28_10685 [Paludibacteraceae bacterium]|nr:hypothetical protein [Paludibacteraceae bacterium]MBP5481166.1 hypothetical protein [Paludibacteraceae bacterium]